MVNKDDYYKNMLLRQFTKSHKYSVPIDNVQLAKRQTKQVTFSHSSEYANAAIISPHFSHKYF